MSVAEIWSNASGLWFGRLVDPITGMPDFMIFTAMSRSSVIAKMRYGLPLTHMEFLDRLCPTDP